MLLVFLAGTLSSQAQIKNLFKYSTFYASASMGAPFSENQQFYVNGTAGSGQLVETTDQVDLIIKLKKVNSMMAQKMRFLTMLLYLMLLE